jgi:hypothetical protein
MDEVGRKGVRQLPAASRNTSRDKPGFACQNRPSVLRSFTREGVGRQPAPSGYARSAKFDLADLALKSPQISARKPLKSDSACGQRIVNAAATPLRNCLNGQDLWFLPSAAPHARERPKEKDKPTGGAFAALKYSERGSSTCRG